MLDNEYIIRNNQLAEGWLFHKQIQPNLGDTKMRWYKNQNTLVEHEVAVLQK